MEKNNTYSQFIGKKFNHLTIIKKIKDHISAETGNIEPLWLCECDCKPSNKNTKIVKHSNLVNNIITCCDICKKKSVKNIIGKKFGKLLVLKRTDDYETKSGKEAQYICKCECGNTVIVRGHHLRNGHTKSCGCAIQIASTKHGLRNTRIYSEYRGMISRCYNSNNSNYKNYGGRGITICDEWLNKEDGVIKFYIWSISNGYRDNLTIDRIDYNGNYCPENCRWVDWETQANNRRNNVLLTLNGVTNTAAIWSKITGISIATILKRKKLEWSDELTLITPENNYIKKYTHSNGKCMTITEWANETGLDRNLIYDRIHKLGWSIDKAISEPIKNQSNMITMNNDTFSYSYWEKIAGFTSGIISHRILRGMNPIEAITTPVKNKLINGIYFIDEKTGEPISQNEVE